jgi:hypothetical protein
MTRPWHRFAPFWLLVAMCFAMPGWAQDAAEKEDSEEEAEEASVNVNPNQPGGLAAVDVGDGPMPFPIHVSASLTQSVGQGTVLFSPDEFGIDSSVNPFFSTSLNLRPTAILPNNWLLLVNQSFQFEWTQSDWTTTPNQIEMFDTAIQARWNGLRVPDYGLIFGFLGGFRLPVSMISRQNGTLTGLSVGANALWSKPDWGLLVNAGFSPTYNLVFWQLAGGATLADQEPYEDSAGNTLVPRGCIIRDSAELENYACSAVPAVFRLATNAGITWTTLDGQVSFNASLFVLNLMRGYLQPQDEFTPEWRNSEGETVSNTPFVGSTDLTSGSLTASWFPTPWFSLSVGTSSFQPLLYADGTWARFPFWDFVSPRNNFSTVFVDTTFSY